MVDATLNTAYVPLMVDASKDFSRNPLPRSLPDAAEVARVQQLIDEGIASGVLEIDAFEALAQVIAKIPDRRD